MMARKVFSPPRRRVRVAALPRTQPGRRRDPAEPHPSSRLPPRTHLPRRPRDSGPFEYWDGDTETAWVVREPVTVYHEGPGQRLAALLTRIAAVRGAPIVTLGTADLALRDAQGERRRIMQADQMVYLDPAGQAPAWVEVGPTTCPLPAGWTIPTARAKAGL